MVELFAWATPSPFPDSPVDHTWVTTYDSRQTPYLDLDAVSLASEHFWTCWGVFHATGRLLGVGVGDLREACCFVKSNVTHRDPAARGTIRGYGVQGVCHQVSNQVLAAIPRSGRPTTVREAQGYGASSFVYGTYGLDKAGWRQRKNSCQVGAVPMSRGTSDFMVGLQTARPGPVEDYDDFEEQAGQVLQARSDLLSQLISLRLDCQLALSRLALTAPSAAALNENNQQYLDRAAELLGPEYFEEIFGYPAGQRVDLIDPEFFGE